MASDDFSATNNPLASPWTSVTGFNALQSTGGEAKRTTGECVMIYDTASVQISEVVVGASPSNEDGGPCLFDTSGNGYLVSNINGTDIEIAKFNAGAFDSVSSAAGTYGTGDTIRLFFDGNDVVCNKNGSQAVRWTESTHRSGLKSGVFIGNADMGITSWTDTAGAGVKRMLLLGVG